MELKGAQVLMDCLKREGVEVVFGYPGGAVLDMYDALAETKLRHITVRHEQGAAHAADGYARSTGKVGVCFLTSGPGVTNAVTGIATAYADSIPLVLVCGQVGTALMGKDAFQEVDTIGITGPCTKQNFLIRDANDIVKTVHQAFYVAASGRPGPVVIDLPKNIMQQIVDYSPEDLEDYELRSSSPVTGPNAAQLEKAVSLLLQAKRPVILAGGGVIRAGAEDSLTRLAETAAIPVISTLMAVGAYPSDGDMSLGMVGMHGHFAANIALYEADVLVAIGTRFGDRVTGKLSDFAKKTKIIHIDIDPGSIRKNVRADVPIMADCKLALEGLLAGIKKTQENWSEKHSSWLDYLQQKENEHPMPTEQNSSDIEPYAVIETLSRLAAPDCIITTEVGQHQIWAAQFFPITADRLFLTSGGLGTMGFGFPAALGAKVGNPERQVIDIAGDGSIQMNIQELATAVENKLAVKIVIMNNFYLGMVRQWQELFYGKRYSCVGMNVQPDFVKLAEAYGAEGYRIETTNDLEPVLKKALSSPGTALIDVRINKGANVWPIVPPGESLKNMRFE